MTKQEYNDIKERMTVIQGVWKKADWVRQIIDQYPQLSQMTLIKVKEWLMERAVDIEIETKRIIGVTKSDKN